MVFFFYLAKHTLGNNGVVFGAKFDDNWNVVHAYTEDIEGIQPFMTSKYVQSSIGSSYYDAKKFLMAGREVLFTGTPCQIAGLHRYLKKDYLNLTTMDFLCHGVPSPKVWRMYLDEIVRKSAHRAVAGKNSVLLSLNTIPSIERIKFRDKSDGWQKYSFVLELSEAKAEGKKNTVLSSYHRDNIYMKGFLNDLYLRPSCHKCKFKRFQSGSDITIADYWAIGRVKPEFFDPMGVSMVFIHNNKLKKMLNDSQISTVETTFEDTLSNNGLNENVSIHPKREYFFSEIDKTKSLTNLISKCIDSSIYKRVILKLKSLVK